MKATLAVVLACFALTACSTTQRRIASAPPNLPEAVYIKTPTLTFNTFFYFALDSDGRIWIKPTRNREETKEFSPAWQLFGTGLPENSEVKDFEAPTKIIALHGDADEIMAVSDTHRFYSMRWLKNPKFPGSPKKWVDKIGWPLERPFFWGPRVAGNRAWCIGRRNQIVKTFEDINGKSFTGGGGLTSYYFLSSNGTEIYFSDSGLPADHSHTMCGPRRSTFVAEGFDVAASTMFVINKRGEMFTRMADFDTIGSDTMFFNYTYDRTNLAPGLISLPSEDWLEHTRIPLTGKARLSSQITIALSGERNEGRELRVAGLGADGTPGFYTKAIFHQAAGSSERVRVDAWRFKPVPGLEIDPSRWLDNAEVAKSGADPGAAAADVVFSGELPQGGLSGVKLRIPDFHLQCSPLTLELSYGDEKVSLILHTVEEWYDAERSDPGHDGTPKKLQGTLEVPESERLRAAGYSSEFKSFLNQSVFPNHLKDFGFWIEATAEYAIIESAYAQYPFKPFSMVLTKDASVHPSLVSARRNSLRRDGFMTMAQSPSLLVNRDLTTLTSADVPALSAKIDSNRAVLKALNEIHERPTKELDDKPFYITHEGYSWLHAAFKVVGYVWEKPATVSRALPNLIAKNQELHETMMFSSKEDFQRAQRRIESRIRAYEYRRDQLMGNSTTPFTYHETEASAWKSHAFGVASIQTDAPLPSDCKLIIKDGAMFDPEIGKFFGRDRTPPSLWMDLKCQSDKESLLMIRIEPSQLLEDELEFSLGRSGKTLSVYITAYIEKLSPDLHAIEAAYTLFGGMPGKTNEMVAGMLIVEDGSYRLELGKNVLNWERKGGATGPVEF